MSKPSQNGMDRFWKGFWPAMAVLTVILAILFRDSFTSGFVHASNDGPLGVLIAQYKATPDVLFGSWVDLSWVGMNGGSGPLGVTYPLLWLLGPVGFAKFYPPITLLLLGASAWIFFRTIKLSPGLCGVTAIAAALNMNFFSNTCWGLGTRSLTLMSAFLALAALNTRRAGNPWINAVLAGLCVGLGVIEGADNGAIFSLFIGAYVVFQAWSEESTWPRRIAGALRLGVVGICAALLAAQVLITLTGIASKTSRGAQSTSASAAVPMTPEEKKAEEEKQWVFATQWSLTPAEMLRVVIPGVYGYRTRDGKESDYWGRVGEYWPAPAAGGDDTRRSSGAGEYAGVLVVLIGLWAVVHACRKGGPTSAFDERERRHVLFWAALFIPAMLFSWGHHAPFYKLVYSLPYFSTIRNPMKFMHPGHMILLILFGYGLLGLSRRYLEAAVSNAGSLSERFRLWRQNAAPIERRWFQISIVLVVVSLIGYLVYSNARGALTRHLQEIGFAEEFRAAAIAKFSAGEVGAFVAFLLAATALVTLIQIGMFSGRRTRWAVILLGALVTLDLARADVPWIKHFDYRAQYASNPVLDTLAKEPWLHRVAVFPTGMIPQRDAAQVIGIMNYVWRASWLQHHAQYYNIQALDMPQDPRPPSEKTNYIAHTTRSLARYWELTNTRYILGMVPLPELLNQQFDPVRRSFRLVQPFEFPNLQYNDLSVRTNQAGPWALIEFGGALPRTLLFTDWQVETNRETTLDMLGNPSFNPHKVVLVTDPIAPPPAANSNAAPGTVEFAHYEPKHIELKATATAPSVLLLNDQFDPDWTVKVDGKPEPLLRCNYLMRGVQVAPGPHTVVFHFQPSLTGMKITLASFGLGLLLCGVLAVSKPRFPESQNTAPVTQKKA